ncbi:MAG: 50S ribosomal protein L11 methyltransferase [Sphingobacteriales bacterium]|nr:MAG: 50S ribosomal protein L11 methyltransferase [Sphingobacteriales bacterium]
MNHIKLSFGTKDQEQIETLMAMLSDLDFIGFEEKDDALEAYMDESVYVAEAVQAITGPMHISYTTEVLEMRNWNEEWEKNFEPVIIDGFCSVRADFHPKPEAVEYDIVITPKMSFGTGHHATTALMMEFMRGLDFRNKCVFDFGTGTGILAILAEMLGAESVLAIDNDEWSVTNSIENAERNNTSKIEIRQATADDLEPGLQFDIILANINRHILLAYMVTMASQLKPGGTLLLSGILPEDISMVRASAESAGFNYQQEKIMNNWVCMQFVR